MGRSITIKQETMFKFGMDQRNVKDANSNTISTSQTVCRERGVS